MVVALEKEIEAIIKNSESKEDPFHSKITKKWVLKLKPNASEELQIAALAHDIERGFPREFIKFKNYHKHKEYHSKRSSEIIIELLKKHGFKSESIDKIGNLVLLHEVGGNEEADILRDADSLAFFELNIYYYYKQKGLEETKFKIRYMYERCSKKTKDIIKRMKFSDKEIAELVKETISQLD